MKLSTYLLAAVLAAGTVSNAAAQTITVVDGDDITITGCILPVNAQAQVAPDVLVWSRSGLLMRAAAEAGAAPVPVPTTGLQERVFYWLDEDLSDHAGQLVEVRGDLEDFRTGEIEISRDGEFTEIELDLEGADGETVRVPTAWLHPGTPDDAEIDIVARRIDVDDVRVVGTCGSF